MAACDSACVVQFRNMLATGIRLPHLLIAA
jgi:hypothetical protein